MAAMTSLSFLYVWLPFVMAVYLLFPEPWRPGALLALSLLYYLVVYPPFLLPLIGCVAADWAALLVMERRGGGGLARKLCLSFSLVKSLGFILWFQGAAPEPLLGLYVVTLSGMGFMLEAYRGQIAPAQSPGHFLLYCFYFPRLAAGPLLPYREFAPQLRLPGFSAGELARGFGLFLQGAVKFRVLGESLLALHGTLVSIPEGDASVLGAWCTVFVLALSVYYRFSGCAAMAKGIAGMMGMTLPQNFYFPYQSQSVTDFFQRFNSTLTHYLEQTLGPCLKGSRRLTCLGFLLTGAAFGLWFGFSAGLVAWGVYLGLFLMMERYLYPNLLQRLPTLFCRIYTLFVILFSFTLFAAQSLGEGARIAGRMLGFGELPFWTDRLGYLLSSNRLLLATGAFFATSAFSLALSFLRKRAPFLAGALMSAVSLFLLILLTAFSIY